MTEQQTSSERAYEELRQRVEGACGLSFGEALDYLDSDDAADLIEEAGLAHLSSRVILERLTGFRI